MGSETPQAIKKRASPALLEEATGPDADASSPPEAKRARRPEERRSSASNAVASGLRPINTTKPAECGIITRIHCENFMCHRSFTVDLCRNVNFIYGQNGSGKSAILAAIQICLGAGARRTHRARNLKDLVRKDSKSGYARIRVTLLNQGDDAYRHTEFGDTITIERTITLGSGYNGYKLLDAEGKEVSRSKKHLEELLDKVNAQVENPVAILDQEEAKKFLTGKAQDKYQFFMKATELERIDRTIANTTDRIYELQEQESRMAGGLEDDENLMKEAKKAYEQHQEIDKMKKKLHAMEEAVAWAYYKQANATLQDSVNQAKAFREKTAKKESELEQEESSTRGKVHDLTTEADSQADLKRQAEQEYKRAREPIKALQKQLKHLERQKNEASRAVQAAQQRLEHKRQEILARAGSAESEAARRAQRMTAAEEELARLKEEYDQSKQLLTDSRQAYDEAEPFLQQARQNVNDAERKLNALENQLHSLQNSSGDNGLAVFGQRVPEPIGSFLKIAPGKEQFAPLAELAMGIGVLDRFIVTNDQDRKTLEQIRQRAGCQMDCGIYQVSPHAQRYDVPKPPPGVETIESTLKISDDLVFNCLVDQCKIEERALATSKEDSEAKLLVNNGGRYAIQGKTIKSVYFLPNGDHWEVRDGAISMVANEKKMRKSIGVDRTAAIQEANRDVDAARQELSVVKREENRLEVQVHEKQKSWNSAKKKNHKLSECINKVAADIDQIRAEENTAETFETDTTDLEQDVEAAERDVETIRQAAERDVETIRQREAEIQTEIESKVPEMEEAKARVEEVDERNSRVVKELQEATDALTNHMASLTQRDAKIQKRREKLEKYKEALKQQEDKLARYKADADQYLKHARILAYSRQKREEQQNNEGMPIEESQFSQDPTDEELEQVEICDVDKEVNYYRARVEKLNEKKEVNYYRARVEKLNEKIEQEKRRRKTSSDDPVAAFERYSRAKEIYESKKEQLDHIRTTRHFLQKDVLKRRERWEHFRGHIAEITTQKFDEILNQKGSSGEVVFDHDSKVLNMIVQKDSADANSQQSDVKALSGGERSYTTIALLLALGESLETPFRILDEFDVFLDPVTRKLTIEKLIEMAKGLPHRQFVFITPQDVSNVQTDPMLKVLKMNPPVRSTVAGGPSQQTLDFS
eukprot:CAMPEP_0176007488 /NCGR_PEP_ID=MMETSP0120_2-20121206/3258_1 /TAXON_ID=160619 /ORGANISM="Kryptoperidinium foliaceum, Strain CCMP 1326" /LENGTH=1160 /DNA_ID=CAMNT_0017340249 /DNA_START=56 /DNA_END=3535 /DNA_ORIENTATION=+